MGGWEHRSQSHEGCLGEGVQQELHHHAAPCDWGRGQVQGHSMEGYE